MDIERRQELADYVRLFLRHPRFDTEAKRLGTIVRLTKDGLTFWRLHAEREEWAAWP